MPYTVSPAGKHLLDLLQAAEAAIEILEYGDIEYCGVAEEAMEVLTEAVAKVREDL